jgi:hypothetical protein
MKKSQQIISLILGSFLLLLTWQLEAQNIRYGFEKDPNNPLRITAVAIPDFPSGNVTIATGLFSFSLPASVEILPAIEAVPASGSFENHTGSWLVQKITPEVYEAAGLSANDLQGNDVYQVVLQNAPELNNVIAEQPIPLFSFEVVNDCVEGTIEILNNEGLLRDAIFQSLRANFNNQISVSINDLPAVNIYDENDPFSYSLECPLVLVSNNDFDKIEPTLTVQPNPAAGFIQTVITTKHSGPGEIIIYDVAQKPVLRQQELFTAGSNTFRLELDKLAPGTYLLMANIKDTLLQKQFVKVNR